MGHVVEIISAQFSPKAQFVGSLSLSRERERNRETGFERSVTFHVAAKGWIIVSIKSMLYKTENKKYKANELKNME